MVDFAEQRYGGLDILVNNAGGAPEPYFPDAEPEHWGRTLDVNLRGTMLGIQFGVRAMRKRGGGAVVNISSMAAMVYQPYGAPEYAASKAGVVHLTAALGSLEEALGIRVNCICPGWVETEAVRHLLAAASREELEQQSAPPPPELILPEEIAELVLMLVRDDSLAGRVVVWPDGERWQLVPNDALYRY
jgi:NAD(P)-dependent dehydrogenase (short-subunit alcohol dehydrogenase family)